MVAIHARLMTCMSPHLACLLSSGVFFCVWGGADCLLRVPLQAPLALTSVVKELAFRPWTQTCNMKGSNCDLKASCLDSNFDTQTRTLKINECASQRFVNNDGVLECGKLAGHWGTPTSVRPFLHWHCIDHFLREEARYTTCGSEHSSIYCMHLNPWAAIK